MSDFDPRTHGFGFSNRFSGGDVVAELIRKDTLSQLTGIRVPRPARHLADVAASLDFWGTFGLCGGMAWAALDRYFGGATTPNVTTPPGPGDDLFSELVERQVASMGGRRLIARCLAWQLTPDRTPWWIFWTRGVLQLTERREWPALRSSLDRRVPASLTLVRIAGLASPSLNHQVVAIGYHHLDQLTVQVHLYDPNHPGDRPGLFMNFNAEGLLVACSQTTGEPVRGFFVSPYQPPP